MSKDVIKNIKLNIIPFLFKGNITLGYVRDIRSLTSSVLPFILGMHKILVHVVKTCINIRHEKFAFLATNMFEKAI